MESMDKERRRGVLERKYGEEEQRRSIDSRRKRCPRGVLLGTLRLFENLVSDFVDLAQMVERRSEEPLALVRFQESTCNSNRVGSSAVERRSAKAEARVRFPAGAWTLRSGNSIGRVPVFQTGDVGSTPTHCMNVAELQAVVAQEVEQSFCKRPIVGSTPARGSDSKSGV